MRQRELIKIMDYKEIVDWMAYDMSCDKEFREKENIRLSLESQKSNTPEQESNLLRQLFNLPAVPCL